VELTKSADWDSMNRPSRKKWKKNRASTNIETQVLRPRAWGCGFPACAARASRHKPARIAVFADRGAATRRPRADKERPAT
jgi:hypothetical protein